MESKVEKDLKQIPENWAHQGVVLKQKSPEHRELPEFLHLDSLEHSPPFRMT
jgi:hypothetical protein